MTVTVVLEKLPSISELNLAWVLSAEAAPLSWDTSDVSSEEDRDKSSRVSAPVADSFRPLLYLSTTVHMNPRVLLPQILTHFH